MKKTIKGFVLGLIIATLLMSTVIGAGVKKTIEVAINSINLTVNGKKVDADTILYQGTTYVPLRAAGEMLGKEVGWNQETKTASINDKGFVEKSIVNPVEKYVKYDNNKLGNIKGNVTWQYNKFIGTKGDTGAQIILIPTNLPRENNNNYFVFNIPYAGLSNEQTQELTKDGIYLTEADGYGYYEVQGIPCGKYHLIIESRNVTKALIGETYGEPNLKHIFSDKVLKELEINTKVFRHYLKEVEIKENKTITKSYDFGYTAW